VSAAAAVLLLGAMPPALLLSCRGDPVARLVGAELAATVLVAFLLVFAQIGGTGNYLILPLFAVPLSTAGTLVYTRCLAPHPDEDPAR
jgi:hypothetical protein